MIKKLNQSALVLAASTLPLIACANQNPTTVKIVRSESALPTVQATANNTVFYQTLGVNTTSHQNNYQASNFGASPARSYTPPAVLGLSEYSNVLQNVNQKTLGRLLKDWQSGQQIVVAHFGDSHVQPGWQVAPIRKALQELKGNAGRGIIFPYKMAKTYSQEDYNSHFTGTWRTANSIQQPPKIGVGVSGFVGVTKDSYATFGFTFKDSSDRLGDIKATVYLRATGTYEITASNGSRFESKTVDFQPTTQMISFDLPNTGRDLNFTVSKKSSDGEFELHAVNLEKTGITGGVVYHNLGVGGAAFNAINQQKRFAEQFGSLNADLVLLDWGTNDILYKNSIAPDLESTIRSTIAKVRAINPDAAIILSSVQESRYKGNPTTAAADLSQMLWRIAVSEDVMFYDWYAVSGKSGSMRVFQDTGYANPKDSIHLNGKGYRVKGEMFVTALINALESAR
ncbi:GDSL-type esterase/lipase family protein [Moraxella marmotae]|uniref:GDSL-type esterase/lipase family protein n=1 Tax=Moraxella marmotae TaxID=3344520 RepID=UPI0035F3DE17